MPYKSQADLAAHLKVSQPRVSQLIKGDGWTWGKGPWTEQQGAEIKASLIDRRAGNNATAAVIEDAADAGDDTAIRALSKNPEKQARIKLVIERTAKIKLERELLAGGYIRKDEVEKTALARVYSVRAKLQELPLRASLIALKTEAECEEILNGWMREVCDHYANGGN